MRSIADFHLPGEEQTVLRFSHTLDMLYAGADPLSQRGRETLQLLDILGKIPALEPAFPDSDFGRGLAQVAALIQAEVGLEVAAVDLGGWDTHFAQGGSEGLMAHLLADLAGGLAAFHAALSGQMRQIIVVGMTEFGRRAYENASLGTDHGHGGLMFLLGGGVNGARVHGAWPGLEPEQLFGPGDLAVTTDYRAVLSELCARRLGGLDPEAVFPGYSPREINVFRRE